jgi:hypothetical protein
MINGVHALLYSTDPDATRDFFRDAMQLSSVDAGRGWLIFALGLYQPYHPTALAIAAEHSARYVEGAQ